MTSTDYLIDSALVLLVLLQLKERKLTNRQLIRPLIILAIAVASYLHGIPTSGNDLGAVAVLGLVGAVLGVASGLTVLMRVLPDGTTMFRSGIASAAFWVLGMGSRFAFAVWITHGGSPTIGRFMKHHDITSAEVWTVALLAMAVAEVLGRTLVMAIHRSRLESSPVMAIA